MSTNDVDYTFRSVGVIGAGTIGLGVAQNLAQVGIKTLLIDTDPAQLAAVPDALRKSLRMQALLRRGQSNPSLEQLLDNIQLSADLAALSAVDAVIENATENWEVKASIYPQIDAICPPHAFFAVNTSAIPITKVASLTNRPAKVLGIHFMNPVVLKPLVEMIRGHHTSDETIAQADALLGRMSKTRVLVQDWPGFVSNRILMLTINEAVFVLQDQVASAEQVDAIFRGCFGHKMGPLETADLIGLDTILNTLVVLYDHLREDKYRPSPLLQKMVDAGLLGRKSDQGFYDYRMPS